VMRAMYEQSYKKGNGFTDDDWWSAVSRAAGGKSFDDFRRRYVEGRVALPYASVLSLAGLKFREQSTPEARVGVATIEDSTGVRVIDIASGSSAAEAGVLPGDYLVSVGDIRVTDSNFGAVFRQKYSAMPEGTPLVIRVRRAGVVRDLPGRLHFGVNIATSLEEDPAASAKARAIRAGLLTGTTRP